MSAPSRKSLPVLATSTLVLCSLRAAPPGGPLDVVIAGHEGFQVWLRQGSGRFQPSEQGFIELPSTTGVALGDLDGDADLDLFVTRYERHPNQVWLNEGKRGFGNSGQSLGSADNWRVALGDLDGDSDLDAFVVGALHTFTSPEGQPHELWLNDGKAAFANSGQRFGRSGGHDAVLVDLDADRDLDAVVVEREGIRIWSNEGKARFREQEPRLSTRPDADCRGIELRDLDLDGDLDAFLARVGPSEVWLNRGKGKFKSGQVLVRGFQTFSVALHDLDGDGDPDAFLANTGNEPNRVLINDGKGRFTDSGQELGADYSLDIALVDCDGDGDADAIEANRESPNRLLLNDGKGRFSDSGQRLGTWKSRNIAIGSLR